MGKIFITGDTHKKMSQLLDIAHKTKMTEDDIIIVCGDFGFIWDDGWENDIAKIEDKIPGTILFVDGNHENFNIIDTLPKVHKFGGEVQKVSDRVYHLLRGEIYTINGHKFFTFGGAMSIDKIYRTVDVSWWRQETPNYRELKKGQQTVRENIHDIEYVLTHECPHSIYCQIDQYWMDSDFYDYDLPHAMDNWYELLCHEGTNFKTWFFGHHHVDFKVNDKAHALYKTFVEIE